MNTETKLKGKFYECGICDCIHPWDWDADCRDDANRLNLDDIADDAELVSWEDRQAADDEPQPQAQHSPLPWKHTHEDGCINDADENLIASEIRYDEGKLIVASVNHADKLAEALRDVLDDREGADDRADQALADWRAAQ